ncbi:gliding motility-associated C-terminal domain-containing protein [Paraflavitalea pollutisoli]|uniref:T9SS type B sorting domain-containing protein n=1 Tax=Paraflavitalea pollutisoli TaxID=3034143 RepID=UPI0023ED6F5D|nr:gliding motility-associated C-terminal domain-containing protein [Paraflavitalea sp. H1-2-19X]
MERSFRRLSFVPMWLLVLLFAANDGWAQTISLTTSSPCPGSTLTVTNTPRSIRTIEWFKDNAPISTVQATWQGTTVAGGNGEGSDLNKFDSALAMAIDATGNIYVSDLNNHRVLKFPPGSTSFINGVVVAGGNGQGNSLDRLNDPAGIFVDATGYLYVADMGNHRVLKFPPGSTSLTDGVVVAGIGGYGQGLTQLNSPLSVYVDGTNRLYVADRDNHRVMRYPVNDGSVAAGEMVAGNGANGASLFQLDQPVSITMFNNRLLVSEYRNHRVTSWDPTNTAAGGILVAGNPAPPGWGIGLNQLHFPTGISVDAGGLLYIADSDNDRIMGWAIDPGPVTTGVAQIDNGEGATADQLNQPLAVYRDGLNAFIVLDLLNNRVQKFTPAIVNTYTPTVAGTYRAEIILDDGTLLVSNNIIIPPANTPTVTITPTAPTLCPGTTTSFTAAITVGGTTPSYTWKLNGVDQPPTNAAVYSPATLHAGDEISVVMEPDDDAGCLTATTATSNLVTVAQHPALAMQATQGRTNICLNDNETLTNATVKASHRWTSLHPTIATIDAPTGLLQGVGAGTATIRYYATSTNGCIDSIDANIVVAALISSTVTVLPGTTAACKGKIMTFTASGTNTGTSPGYAWLVNGVAAGVTGTSFSADTLKDNAVVQIVLTPDVGCKASPSITSTPITVTVHPLPVVAPITGTTAVCDQSTTQLTNSTTNATYTWKSLNPGVALVDNTGKVSGISAGQAVIRFIAESAHGCADSVQTTVTVGPLVTPTITVQSSAAAVCAGKPLVFTATSQQSGINPTYAWQVNGVLTGATGTTYSRNDLQPGDVVIGVLTPSAEVGCLAKASFESLPVSFTIHPLPVMAPITGDFVLCLNSSTQLSTTSAAGVWKTLAPSVAMIDAMGKITAVGLGDALIRFVSTAAAGCMDSVEQRVGVQSLYTPTLSASASAQTICAGEPVTFTAVAGPAGNQPRLEWFVNNVATGQPGLTYTNATLQPGDLVHVVLTPSPDAGCVSAPSFRSLPVAVTVRPIVTPTFTVTPGANAVCTGKPLLFTASSQSSGTTPTYTWQVNGAPTGATGVTYTRSDLQQGDVVTCILTPSPDAGCLAKASFESAPATPTIHPLPVMAPIKGLFDICLQSSTQLITASTGGVWKSLSPSIATIDGTGKLLGNGIGTALIRYVATTGAGCQDSVEQSVTVRGLYTPTLSVSTSANAICQGDRVTFTANAGPAGTTPTFEWFKNNQPTGTAGISYSSTTLVKGDVVHVVMTPSADAGCVSSPTINSMAVMVTVGQPPVLLPITGNAVLCSGATTQLANATAGVGGAWRSLNTIVATISNTGLVSGVQAGNAVIRYIGTTPIGCRDSVDVTVTVNPSVVPSLTIDASHNDTCTGVAIQFTAQARQGGSQPFYQWQVNGQPTGTGAQWSSASLRNGDIVRCVLASNATCASPASVTSNEIVLAIHALPVIDAGPDKTILRGKTTLLQGRVSDDVTHISWTPVSSLQNATTATPVASPFSTTRYQLEASTAKGCLATDAVTISVIETVKVPNAFSPNGDGIHDTWEIPDLGAVAQVDIQVFNRQGQPVYQASSYQRGKGWNGSYKGYVLPAGTYYYVIDLKNGQPKLSGAVTLLK